MPHQDDLADDELSALIERVVAADFGEGDTASGFALDEHIDADPRRATMHAGVMELWDELGALESPPLSHETAGGRNNYGTAARGLWSRAGRLRAAASVFPTIAAASLSLLGVAAIAAGNPATEIDAGTAGSRAVGLDDGSIVNLIDDGALSVRLKSQRRDIVLKRGGATFKVASDPDRPFVVAAGNGRIQAVGSAFNVELKDKHVVVTAIEGVVIVEARQSGTAGTRLQFVSAGQQVKFGQKHAPSTRNEKRAVTLI